MDDLNNGKTTFRFTFFFKTFYQAIKQQGHQAEQNLNRTVCRQENEETLLHMFSFRWSRLIFFAFVISEHLKLNGTICLSSIVNKRCVYIKINIKYFPTNINLNFWQCTN